MAKKKINETRNNQADAERKEREKGGKKGSKQPETLPENISAKLEGVPPHLRADYINLMKQLQPGYDLKKEIESWMKKVENLTPDNASADATVLQKKGEVLKSKCEEVRDSSESIGNAGLIRKLFDYVRDDLHAVRMAPLMGIEKISKQLTYLDQVKTGEIKPKQPMHSTEIHSTEIHSTEMKKKEVDETRNKVYQAYLEREKKKKESKKGSKQPETLPENIIAKLEDVPPHLRADYINLMKQLQPGYGLEKKIKSWMEKVESFTPSNAFTDDKFLTARQKEGEALKSKCEEVRDIAENIGSPALRRKLFDYVRDDLREVIMAATMGIEKISKQLDQVKKMIPDQKQFKEQIDAAIKKSLAMSNSNRKVVENIKKRESTVEKI